MLQIDFENDLKNEITKVSLKLGIKINPNLDLDNILSDYLTVRLKIIDPKIRKVKFNPAFFATINSNSKIKEIQSISRIASFGGDLNIFQSKKLFQTKFHDHLRNEWNIYHFHLSNKIENKTGFVKQVNELLFAYIDDEQIIFLGTDTHKEGIFADTKWIEVLHDYFPDVIIKFRDDTIFDVNPKVNSVDRQILWNKGYSLGFTKIRDVVYHSPGLGRTTSGHSIEVSMTASEIMRWIYKLKEQLIDCEKELCNYLGISIDKANFKIRIRDKIELVETFSNTILLHFSEILISKDELIKRMR